MNRIGKRIGTAALAFLLFISMLSVNSLVKADSDDAAQIYHQAQSTVATLVRAEENGDFESIWYVMDLARDEQDLSQTYLNSLLQLIVDKKGELHTGVGDYTNYAKIILALTACGIDPREIGDYNLIDSVSQLPLVRRQGVNGVIYALLALDCHNYEITVSNYTRDNYVNAIVSAQLEDGGWDYANKKADPDMTAMALQALAPYSEREDVKAAIERALLTLSNLQQEDGGFKTEDAADKESSESTSMVIMALLALGIDPDTDTRFIKNGNTTINNLLLFAKNGGFCHVIGQSRNNLATDQGYRALLDYYRFKAGKTTVYDMSDVEITGYVPQKNGWYEEEGQWYYYKNDIPCKGWLKDKGYWYYLDPETAVMKTGWQTIEDEKYFLAGDGHMVINAWGQDEGDWYYVGNNGKAVKGWLSYKGNWYYMDPETGAMKTGWQSLDSGKYFLAGDGHMVVNAWGMDEGCWYYVGNNGAAVKGWNQISGKWYYMDPETAAMKTGWVKSGSSWYFMLHNGAMATGWVFDNGNWYYMDVSGAMVTGWKQINGTWYYFKSSGAMASSEWFGGYWFSSDGAWTYPGIGSWKSNATGWWFGDTLGWYAKNETLTINEKGYTFNESGYWVEE